MEDDSFVHTLCFALVFSANNILVLNHQQSSSIRHVSCEVRKGIEESVYLLICLPFNALRIGHIYTPGFLWSHCNCNLTRQIRFVDVNNYLKSVFHAVIKSSLPIYKLLK